MIEICRRQCVALQAVFVLIRQSIVDAMNTIDRERLLRYAIAAAHGDAFTSGVLCSWCSCEFLCPTSYGLVR